MFSNFIPSGGRNCSIWFYISVTKTIKRCWWEQFKESDVLCLPGKVINVTNVYLSHQHGGCDKTNEDCTFTLPIEDDFHQNISLACNGRHSCDNINAEHRKIKWPGCNQVGNPRSNYYSDYVAIQYECIAGESDYNELVFLSMFMMFKGYYLSHFRLYF